MDDFLSKEGLGLIAIWLFAIGIGHIIGIAL